MFYRCEDVSAAAGGEGGFRQNLKVVDIEVIKHICVQLSWFAIAYGLAGLEQKMASRTRGKQWRSHH